MGRLRDSSIFVLFLSLFTNWKVKDEKRMTYHIDARTGAFRGSFERTSFAVSADGSAPSASVFFGSSDA